MHRIERQTVELSIGPRSDALAVQERLAAAMRGGGAAALERVFDRVARDRMLRIDRLELDLGAVRGDDWLDVFLERLASATARALEGEAGGSPDFHGQADAGEPRGTAENLRVAVESEDRLEALAQFLATGRLPWWSRTGGGKDWVRSLCRELDDAGRRRLIAFVAERPAALQRLRVHLHPSAMVALLRAAYPSDALTSLAAACEEIEAVLDRTPTRLWAWRAGFWQPLFHAAAAGEGTLDPRRIARSWTRLIAETHPEALAALASASAAALVAPSLPKPWHAALAAEVASCAASATQAGREAEPARPAHPSAEPPPLPAPPPAAIAAPGQRPQAAPMAGHPSTQPPSSFTAPPAAIAWRGQQAPTGATAADLPEPTAEATDVIAVRAAGVILIHPFLAELFAHLGLTHDGRFVDPDARQRAVHVLGYLAFGATGLGEPDLLLAKLLCGIPFETPLLPVDLEDGELATADALMAAVIGHWSALRTASVAWLREHFFLRDGTLQPIDAGWSLTVESRAQDVLLGKLPWGIGVIVLPWSETVLHVRWRD